MTRLMYWNIQKFSDNTINYTGAKRRKTTVTPDARLNTILDIIWQVAPDIFVIVETQTGWDGRGRLVRGSGREGSLNLLDELNLVAHANNQPQDWSMVPPLQTGPREAVTVYFRTTDLTFTGPYVWPGGGAAVAAPAGQASADYPDPFDEALPAGAVPAGALQNVGVPQNQLAARVEFTYAQAHPNAGTPIAYPAQRAPYMVTFLDTGGANPRNVSVFAIHAPASNAARAYLQDLASVAQIVDDLDDDEVRVICGDLNWNILTNELLGWTSYNPLIAGGYTLTLPVIAPPLQGGADQPQPPLDAVPDPALGYAGYFGTHLDPNLWNASPYSTDEVTAYYPGYRYFSDSDYAIDNIYTQYGANLPVPNDRQATVINPIVGSPYDLHDPPSDETPEGSIVLPIMMGSPLFQNPPDVGPPHDIGGLTTFQNGENLGLHANISDHLSLAIDI